MKFGQKLKLKKDWERGGTKIDFIGDAEFTVIDYDHKYGMNLHHERVIGCIEFNWHYTERDERIAEYFEILPTTCTWSQDDECSGTYHTSCKGMFDLNDGTPAENKLSYCPYCGNELVEKLWEDQSE